MKRFAKIPLGLALLLLALGVVVGGVHAAAGSGTGASPTGGPAGAEAAGFPAGGFTEHKQSGPGPHEVWAGVYIMNIQTINLSENRFDADFYLWLRWRGDIGVDPTDDVSVMNAHERWALNSEPVTDEPRVEPDGTLFWMVRFQGNFNTSLSLKRYPFDRQTLELIIEDEALTAKDIVYRPDENPVGINPEITLPGYEVGKPRISFSEFTYEIGPEVQTYPRITVQIPVTPPTASGVIKVVVPMLIVLAAAAIALVIPSSHVDSKIALPITSLLALVAMHWGISVSVQEANYLLMVDVLYIVAFATATAFLAVSIASAWTVASRGEDAAFAMQRRMLGVISIAYVAAVAVVLLVYLH